MQLSLNGNMRGIVAFGGPGSEYGRKQGIMETKQIIGFAIIAFLMAVSYFFYRRYKKRRARWIAHNYRH